MKYFIVQLFLYLDTHGYITVGATVGIAVGSSIFVFIVMWVVLVCVVKSHKRQIVAIANAPPSPPSVHM